MGKVFFGHEWAFEFYQMSIEKLSKEFKPAWGSEGKGNGRVT